MDILAIILACSLHPDDELLRTLVDIESSGNVYFVGDLATLKTNDSLTSAEAALRFAEDLRRHGGRPAVGLLGVPLDWAGRYGRAPIELFDACTNVAIATAAFTDYARACVGDPVHVGHRAPTPARRRSRRLVTAASVRYCIVSHYARDLGLAVAPAATLKRLIAERGGQPGAAPDTPVERSPVLFDRSEPTPSTASHLQRSRIVFDGSAISHEVP
jgi:hypothetical protein